MGQCSHCSMSGVQELLDCQIANWYPRFQRVTFKTAILPLPQPVLDWLVSDGLHLPADSQAVSNDALSPHPCRTLPRLGQQQRAGGAHAALAAAQAGGDRRRESQPGTSMPLPAVCQAGRAGPIRHRGRLPGVAER